MKEQRRVVVRRDPQPYTAPFERMARAGEQVFDFAYAAALAGRADLDVPEVEPELPRSRIGERNAHRHGVVAGRRFLHEADDLRIVNLREAQSAGLLQCGVA